MQIEEMSTRDFLSLKDFRRTTTSWTERASHVLEMNIDVHIAHHIITDGHVTDLLRFFAAPANAADVGRVR